MYFELDNDDMELSKRRSVFISRIFTLKISNLAYILVTTGLSQSLLRNLSTCSINSLINKSCK